MNARRLIAIAGTTFALASWMAVGVGLVFQVERSIFVTLVFIAAFATEAMIWCLAAAFGLTIFQARRKIWRWMAGRFTERLQDRQ